MRPTMTLILTLIVTALFSLGTSALAEDAAEVPCFYDALDDEDEWEDALIRGEVEGSDVRPVAVDPPSFCARTAGEVGFSFGLVSSPNSLLEWSPEVGILWWATDRLGIGGDFRYAYSTSSEDDAPSQMSARGDLLLSYVLAAGETTRLSISGGVGFQYDSETVPFGLDGEFELKTSTYAFTLPIALGVEHFFTDTIALSVGAGFDLLAVGSADDGKDDTDDPSYYFFSIDTTQLFVNLTWYTD